MSRRCTSGATPTTPSGGSPPKAQKILFQRPIASKCCRASAISRPTRRPIASTSCCYRTLRLIPCSALSLRLVDIPEHRRGRAAEHAGERFPPRGRRHVLPERNVNHLLIDARLNLGGDFLLFVRRGRAGVGVAHLFHLGVLRPAEPAAVLALAAARQACN